MTFRPRKEYEDMLDQDFTDIDFQEAVIELLLDIRENLRNLK